MPSPSFGAAREVLAQAEQILAEPIGTRSGSNWWETLYRFNPSTPSVAAVPHCVIRGQNTLKILEGNCPETSPLPDERHSGAWPARERLRGGPASVRPWRAGQSDLEHTLAAKRREEVPKKMGKKSTINERTQP